VVGAALGRARQLIADGRSEIKAYVASQPKAMKKLAADAQDKIGDQFDSLDSDVSSKQEDVAGDLAKKYVDSRQAVDDAITSMQADNRGLIDKAVQFVEDAVGIVLKLKDMLLNVLSRVANAVTRIIADPIGFLGKMVNAVKAGLTKFVDNIGTHLKKGLLDWLFGALASAGLELPESFDLKGILKLVLSLVGLTWSRIRGRIVGQVGEEAMAKMEKTVDVFKIVATEGLGGLWEWVVERMGDFKDMVMGEIHEFISSKVIRAGIEWVIGLLNPAGAFIKACEAIYHIVMFFVEKGSQIKDFVDSILDSVESILDGGAGAVADLIENTLAKGVPLIIDFLADLLGLGGIADKIKEIIGKIQAPVNKAIDAVIKGGLKVGKAMFGGLIAKGKGLYSKGKDWAKGKAEGAKHWAKGKAAGIAGGWQKLRDRLMGVTFRQEFEAAGETHSIYTKKGEPTKLYTASDEGPTSARAPTPDVIRLDSEFQSVMSQYWAVAAHLRGDDKDAGLVAEADQLRARAKRIVLQLTRLVKGYMSRGTMDRFNPRTSAPGVGMVGRHGQKPPSHREEGAPLIWQTESEHVIPYAVGMTLWDMMSMDRPDRGTPTDKSQTTIMIYYGAARRKTPVDLEIIADFEAAALPLEKRMKAAVREYEYGSGKETANEVYGEVLNELRDTRAEAVARTEGAIAEEHADLEPGYPEPNGSRRGEPGGVPDGGKVAHASEMQYDDLLHLAQDAKQGFDDTAAARRQARRDKLAAKGFKLVNWHGD
jgi:hypothetical protein